MPLIVHKKYSLLEPKKTYFSLQKVTSSCLTTRSLYSITGGEKELAFTVPDSDSTAQATANTANALDYVWQKMLQEYPQAASVEIHFSHSKDESIYAHVNPSDETYWKTESRYFDRYTLQEIEVEHLWGKLEDAGTADIVRRMNYDIHTGAIAALPGKILAFAATLIAASLPVTGFLMWWRKRREKNKLRKGLDF